MRFVAAKRHPDHDTISKFRHENFAAVADCFLQVLLLPKELKLLKLGTVSVDGTKLKASASKHRSVMYQRAGELAVQARAKAEAEQAEYERKLAARRDRTGAEGAERGARREAAQGAQGGLAAGDGGQAEDGRGQGAVPAAEADGRAGVRDHQVRARVPQFLVMGVEKVTGEWNLVDLAYNCKRLHRLRLEQGVQGAAGCQQPTGKRSLKRDHGAGLECNGAASPFRAAMQSHATIALGAIAVSHPSPERSMELQVRQSASKEQSNYAQGGQPIKT